MKYIYCIPFGGFGDQLATINKAIKYCKKYNRILIIETQKSKYNVNYEDYFGFQYENVILDKNKIGLLICNNELTIERSIHEEPREPTCFDCHVSMIRKWDSPSITFKGKGFYSTDK